MRNPTTNVVCDASAAPGRSPDSEERVIGEQLWWPPWETSAGVDVSERTALQVSSLLATVIVLATDVAWLPRCVYRRRADGGRDEVRDDPRDELLRLSPDGETTAFRFFQDLMGHALLWGGGFAEIQRVGRGTPARLFLLDPSITKAERDKSGRLFYKNGQNQIAGGDVLHISGLGFDGVSGYRLVQLLRQAIGLTLASETHAANFFANGAEPGIVLEHPGKLKELALANLRDSWDQRHRGPNRAHRPAILEDGMKVSRYGADPEQSQLLETRRYQVNDVTRPWRVPPHKIGDFSQAHLANIEASNLDYLTTALMPWLESIEQQCNLKLFSAAERKAGLYMEHNVNALLKGDIKSRFDAYNSALLNGWMTRDEVRSRENMNPIGAANGGDKFLVQAQMTPLDQAGIAFAAPPSTPPPTEEPSDELATAAS